MQNLSAKNHRKIQTPGLWHRFCPPVGKQNDMPLTDTSRNEIANSLSILKVIAGVVLLAAVSWEIIGGDHTRFSQSYLTDDTFFYVQSQLTCTLLRSTPTHTVCQT